MKNIISILIILIISLQINATNYPVKNSSDLNSKLKKVLPGDTITMLNGVWTNVQLIFEADGAEGKPIVLIAETPGKVIIEGESALVLSGDYLHVSGLLFTGGYSPFGAVISFAKNSKNPSNYCRVTNCAIVDFSKSERFDKDNWVAVFGKHNRFDHNYLAGKLNAGVTLAVYLNNTLSQENHNRIDHNYFGERKRLGSNGGETLRVGTSTYSLISANTTIEDNYFERCNGEVEALSIKATNCVIRRNAFFETEGCFALRHGNNNQVYGNLFIGNGKPATAGLRVINAGHDIHDNYFFRLKGERFRSALAVMNGVPNSAINRYHQVKDAKIYNNTFIDCSSIEFGTGSDSERTATPLNTTFSNNTIYQSLSDNPIIILDDVSGVKLENNLFYAPNAEFDMAGFHSEMMKLKKDKLGLYRAIVGKDKKNLSVGNICSDKIIQKQEAGTDWYSSISMHETRLPMAHKANNEPGNLEKTLMSSLAGDTIILISEGTYTLSEPIVIDKLTYLVASPELENCPEIIFNDDRTSRKSHILLTNGGNLSVKGIAFNGTTKLGNKTTSAIKTDTKGMNQPYWMIAEDCEFYNFNESRYSAFRAEKGSYADSVIFNNCLFHTISGDAISISAEKDDRGIYNAEFVKINNSIFYNIMGSALDLYRGGNDESTLGPFLEVNNCLFENVNNKELGSVLRLIGVQVASISNSVFSNSGRGGRSVKFEETRWNDCVVINCNLYNSGRIESFYNNVVVGDIYDVKPIYFNKEEHDFRLSNSSDFSEGINIGIDNN